MSHNTYNTESYLDAMAFDIWREFTHSYEYDIHEQWIEFEGQYCGIWKGDSEEDALGQYLWDSGIVDVTCLGNLETYFNWDLLAQDSIRAGEYWLEPTPELSTYFIYSSY